MALPVLDEVARSNDVEVVYYLNVEKYDYYDLQDEFGVSGVPTVLKIEDGELAAISTSEEYQPKISEESIEGLSDEEAYNLYFTKLYEKFIKGNAK